MSWLLKNWQSIALAGVVASGCWLSWYQGVQHMQAKVDVANATRVLCIAARDNLEELTREQGAKLGELANQAEQRQVKAAQAVADAKQQADQHYAAAQRLQQEHAAGDQAAVVEALIDKELGL